MRLGKCAALAALGEFHCWQRYSQRCGFLAGAMAGWRVVARRGEMASYTSTPGLGTGQPLQRILRVLVDF